MDQPEGLRPAHSSSAPTPGATLRHNDIPLPAFDIGQALRVSWGIGTKPRSADREGVSSPGIGRAAWKLGDCGDSNSPGKVLCYDDKAIGSVVSPCSVVVREGVVRPGRLAAIPRTHGRRPCHRSRRFADPRPARPLERDGKRRVEDRHSPHGLVDAGGDGRPGVAHDRDVRRARVLRDLRGRPDGRDPLPRETLSRGPSRAAGQSDEQLRVAFADDGARSRVRPFRQLRHRLPGHEDLRGPVEAGRSALSALSRAGLVGDFVRGPADPDHGRRGRAVRRGAGQGDRAHRLEDRPHRGVGRPRRGRQAAKRRRPAKGVLDAAGGGRPGDPADAHRRGQGGLRL